MTDLNELARECQEVAVSKGWEEEKRTFGDLISLMHSELSEALEEFREGHDYDMVYFEYPESLARECPNIPLVSNLSVYRCGCILPLGDKHLPGRVVYGKPQGIPIELADAIIRILQTCANLGIDIDEAFRTKMQYNKTRPHRHGGKVI